MVGGVIALMMGFVMAVTAIASLKSRYRSIMVTDWTQRNIVVISSMMLYMLLMVLIYVMQ